VSTYDVERWQGALSFLVDGGLELQLDADQTLDELGAAFMSSSQAPPIEGRESLVLALDPAHWFQLECPQGVTLGRWLQSYTQPEGWKPGDPLRLESAREKLCMHSSPAVPGLGYACGWC
jgi:hypothetical protein